jgi:hypothetical protein
MHGIQGLGWPEAEPGIVMTAAVPSSVVTEDRLCQALPIDAGPQVQGSWLDQIQPRLVRLSIAKVPPIQGCVALHFAALQGQPTNR